MTGHLINNLNVLFSGKQKRQVLFLFAVMVVGALLEVLGVSAVVPFVTVMTQENFIETIPFLGEIYTFFGFSSESRFALACIVGLIGIYFVKSVYLILEVRLQAGFISRAKLETQERLVRILLNHPYIFFVDRNSSEFHKILAVDLKKVYQVLQQALIMLTELTVSVMLLITLFIIDPVMTSGVIVMIGAAVLLIGTLIRPKLHNVGVVVQEEEKARSRWISQGFAGIKEVKHMHAEEFIARRICEAEKTICGGERVQQVLNSSPRIIIETVCICGMLAVLALMVNSGRTLSGLLPAISAFAMATIRLLPCASRVTSAVAALVYNMPAFDGIVNILSQCYNVDRKYRMKDLNCHDLPVIKDERIDIWLQDVTYSYPGTQKKILDKVSLEVFKGEMVGIIGMSGSGKTTLADLIMGLLVPDSGEVSVRERIIGYIPQSVFLIDDSIRANVAFGIPVEVVDEELVWASLKESQLADFIDQLPEKLDTRTGERGVRLSGGQIQRIGIARALYRKPSILIFDEATSALDLETEAAVMESIISMHGKRTILIVAHKSGILAGCDSIYRVERGKLFRVKPEEEK